MRHGRGVRWVDRRRQGLRPRPVVRRARLGGAANSHHGHPVSRSNLRVLRLHNGLYLRSRQFPPTGGGWTSRSTMGAGLRWSAPPGETGSSRDHLGRLFSVGSEILSATFRGVAPFLGSSSNSVPVTVTKRSSGVSLIAYPNPVPANMQEAMSIHAEPGTGIAVSPDFEVTGGAHNLVATQTAGSTYAVLDGLAIGTHDFRAEYAGDAQTQPSTSDVLPIEVVPPVSPTVSLTPLLAVTTNGSIALAWSGTPVWSPIASYDVRSRRAPLERAVRECRGAPRGHDPSIGRNDRRLWVDVLRQRPRARHARP